MHTARHTHRAHGCGVRAARLCLGVALAGLALAPAALARPAGGVRPAVASAISVQLQQRIAGSSEAFTESELTGRVGQTVEYNVVIHNNLGEAVTIVELQDGGCEGLPEDPDEELEAGGVVAYSCSEPLSEGIFFDEVNVTAELEDGSTIVYSSNTVVLTVPTPEPSFSIEELQRLRGGAFTTEELTANTPGEAVEYETVIENTGNTPLTLGELEGGPNCFSFTITGGPTGTLEPGESTAYFCEGSSGFGPNSNQAQITATPPEDEGPPITDSSNTVVLEILAEPSFETTERQELEGSHNPTTGELTAKVGDTVVYEIAITNTGNVPLKFTVEDSGCENLAPPVTEELRPYETYAYFCEAELGLGLHENSATVTGTAQLGEALPVTESTNTVVADVPEEPAFTIEKLQRIEGEGEFTEAPLEGAAGEQVEYEVIVGDTGNTPLELSDFEDNSCEGVRGGASAPLQPSESATYTCHRTLTYGENENQASVVASFESYSALEFSNTVDVFVPDEPGLEVEKLQRIGSEPFTTERINGAVGETVEYEIMVANTGDVPLELNVEDPGCEGLSGAPPGALPPGEEVSYTCSHVLEAGSWENQATVTGTPPPGPAAPVTETTNTVIAEAASVEGPPEAEILSPKTGGSYQQGEKVATSFKCEAGASATLQSCQDSTGHSGSAGELDTKSPGKHTYTVTATDTDGQTAQASIEYTVSGPPKAEILSPKTGGSYQQGEKVATSFKCEAGASATLQSCQDSTGHSGSAGELDTKSPGKHTYTVTATDTDGQTAQASIEYTVSGPPKAEILSPKTGGSYQQGEKVATSFKCEAGASATLQSCQDSTGHSGSAGELDTKSPGKHTYTVTATDTDGQTAQASIEYTVSGASALPICPDVVGGAAKEVIIPKGLVCRLPPGSRVAQDVRVQTDAGLVDEGASIGSSLLAQDPAGIRIGGPQLSVIKGGLRIEGMTGGIFGQANSICNAEILGELVLLDSAATARPVLVGRECAAGSVAVRSIDVARNANAVSFSRVTSSGFFDFERNSGPLDLEEDSFARGSGVKEDRGPTRIIGNRVAADLLVAANKGTVLVDLNTIGEDLSVDRNTGGVEIVGNSSGDSEECRGNKPAATGRENAAKRHNYGCPV